MRIFKYTLDVVDTQAVAMPIGAKILTVQLQKERVCLWAVCDEAAGFEFRKIAIFGTGHSMPDIPMKYISTFQMYDGDLIFHAFEVLGD